MEEGSQSLQYALAQEAKQFEKCYLWLEKHMPRSFFEEFDSTKMLTISHHLMGFDLQGKFIQVNFEQFALVICEDSLTADMQILRHYSFTGIKSYQTYVSDEPPPLPGVKHNLRIGIIYFTQFEEKHVATEGIISEETKKEACETIRKRNPEFTTEEMEELLSSLSQQLLRTLNKERLILLLEMFFRAKTRDHIQYEVKKNEDWDNQENPMPSMQIVLAWKNTQKYNFLFRFAKMIYRHGVVMQKVSASYVKLPSSESVLLMSIALHGKNNKAVWNVTNITDFLQELATLKYFEDADLIESVFVSANLLRGNLANLLRALRDLSHQLLLHFDANIYSLSHVEEAFVRHPELTVEILQAFEYKFHPEKNHVKKYQEIVAHVHALLEKLDTGNLVIDTRRKNIFTTLLLLIHYIQKTNFYRNNKSAFGFRIDPHILEKLPYDTTTKFPEIPFAIFFFKGKAFIGFHIRFKDLSRGGLRTVFLSRIEQAKWEKTNIFAECYQLAYTQQKKNKDIPEGGSKGIIFIEAFEDLSVEAEIYRRELKRAGLNSSKIESMLLDFEKEQKLIFLYQSQRSYVYTLLSLVNCHDDGTLKSRNIVDYYGKPEYLYLGPDENMHNSMIEWIADHACLTGYKPMKAFISSKPKYGINHKEYGVTSFGVNVYMHRALEYMGIDPTKEPFTIKISGGPDGDVAGNQIHNLYRFYRNTAQLLAITDISGTMYDPKGFDLEEMMRLFHEGLPLAHYPPEKLSEGGFLLDMRTKKEKSSYSQLTLCYKKKNGKIVEDWLSGSDTFHIFTHNLHSVVTDVFIPAGGRPKTLNESNWTDFLDETGKPTSKAIIEGANLYLTPKARSFLEEKGVLIFKDSSANKGGVICSSLEVLLGLILEGEEFLQYKQIFMPQVLDFIKDKALLEANLLLKTHDETKLPLTTLSDQISEKINTYMYQILDALEKKELVEDPKDPLIQALVQYSLPFIQDQCVHRLIHNVPDIHKKAIISCYIASKMVYGRGLGWAPSIVDILPLVVKDIIN